MGKGTLTTVLSVSLGNYSASHFEGSAISLVQRRRYDARWTPYHGETGFRCVSSPLDPRTSHLYVGERRGTWQMVASVWLFPWGQRLGCRGAFCLPYAGHCRAEKPAALRELIRERLEQALSQHQED